MDKSKKVLWGKVTWGDIYKDFKFRHPNLSKDAVGYGPHGYATIVVWFEGGKKMLYNYDSKKAVFVVDND